MHGNDRADKLANTAPIGAKTIQWDGEEVLNQLINESRKQLECNQDYHLERLRDKGYTTRIGSDIHASREDEKYLQPRM